MKKLLFVITKFFLGGAENTLLNLFKQLSPEQYTIDFLILNQQKCEVSLSLIPYIPEYINTFNYIDIYKENAWTGELIQMEQAKKLLSEEQYDAAFHIGEWYTPEFVALYANALIKAIWLHSDLNRIQNIAKREIEQFAYCFDYFIFVSRKSMLNSFELFPFMERNSVVVHNLIDTVKIAEKAEEKLLSKDEVFFHTDLPVFLSISNIRPEKQHLLCLDAMHILKERGIEFRWLFVGAKSDPQITKQLEQKIAEYGLHEQFILLGARDNPYPLVKNVEAVTVCSYVESWSLVITEALAMEIPVIATPTSGALEQIDDGVNGVISKGFTAEDIADAIERFLKECKTLKISSSYDFYRGVSDFTHLVKNAVKKHKILYIIEDVNYVGGAHKAAFTQIERLVPYYDITILSGHKPRRGFNNPSGVQIITFDQFGHKHYVPFLLLSTKAVLTGNYSIWQKITKCIVFILKKLKLYRNGNLSITEVNYLDEFLESFDSIVSLSEGSHLRTIAAKPTKPKKIQWIHQNYKLFYNWSDWTREITANDANLYKSFDAIITLSEICRNDFLEIHPHLAPNTLAIRNFAPSIPAGVFDCETKLVDIERFNIITVARMDEQKNIFGYVTIAKLLKSADIVFRWYLVGDGPLKEELDKQIHSFGLSDNVITTGSVKNPYYLLKQCDLFVLFSFAEGTPITIEEAQSLHIPVIARKIGGIPDLIEDGVTGWLVDGDEMDCFMKIMDVINSPKSLQEMHKNLASMKTQDEEVLMQLRNLFK